MVRGRKLDKAARSVESGNGRALKPFRWWQPLSRAVMSTELEDEVGKRAVYTVDVPYWMRIATSDGRGKAYLYADGVQRASSRLPAGFPVPGGFIDVQGTSFGLKRCHYVADDGTVRQLVPEPRSAEGRRAALESKHPVISRLLGLTSLVLVLFSLVLGAPQVIELLSEVPPVHDRFGEFTSPIQLGVWANVTLGLCFATASVERATRLQHHALLDVGD